MLGWLGECHSFQLGLDGVAWLLLKCFQPLKLTHLSCTLKRESRLLNGHFNGCLLYFWINHFSGKISNIKVKKKTQTYTYKHVLTLMDTQAQAQSYMLKTQLTKGKENPRTHQRTTMNCTEVPCNLFVGLMLEVIL